jgi:hypothetical protein
MRTLNLCAATALFFALIVTAGCGARKVSGNLYVTSAGDMIKFFNNGKAVEVNGMFGMIYPRQSVYMGEDGMSPRTNCTYKQAGVNVTLTCDGGERADFTVNADGSLNGPPEGMWGDAAFSHLNLKK